jgi:hypothetical protein
MPLTVTSTTAAIDANTLVIPVTSASGATVGGFCRINNEYSVITAITGLNISVRCRGDQGSNADPHNALAPVTFGLQTDLPAQAPGATTQNQPHAPDIQSYGVSGAIDVTLLTAPETIIYLTKATAAAMTLVGPSKAQDGIKVTFVSTTAAAHTVTYTAGFSDNTTSSDVATFAATVGASFTIVASKGKWAAVSLGVTIA